MNFFDLKSYEKVNTVSADQYLSVFSKKGKPVVIKLEDFISEFLDSSLDDDFLPLAGGTMTGDIITGSLIKDPSGLNTLTMVNENDIYLTVGKAAGTLYLNATNTINATANGGANLLINGTSDNINLATGSGIGFSADATSGITLIGGGDQYFQIDSLNDIAKISTQNNGTIVFSPTGLVNTVGLMVFETNIADDAYYMDSNGGAGMTIDGGGDSVNFYTTFNSRININSNASAAIEIQPTAAGYVRVYNIDTYANDAAAGVGGVPQDGLYKTAAGALMIKL